MDSTHSRTTSGVACHHRLLAAQMVERHRAWHAIITFWAAQTVERRQAGHDIIAFGLAHTVRQRRAWHAIIALGRQTRSNDVGHGMPSSPLGSTDDRTTSGMAWHHYPWIARIDERRRGWHDITTLCLHRRSNDIRSGMTSPPLGSTHGQRRRAWHAIIILGRPT